MTPISSQPQGHTLPRPSTLQQAAFLHQQGRLWEAEQLYLLALKANGRDFECLCRLGVLRLQQSRFEEAAGLFRKALQQNKKSAELHQYLAFALTGMDRAEEAIACFRKALALRPGFAEAHNNLGHALQKLNRLDEAAAEFRKALSLNSSYPEAHNNLGNVLHLLDRHEEAIAEYERALAIRPNYAESYWNIGNALRATGRLEAAIAQYEKALKIRPDYAEAHNGLGNTLRTLGRTEEAIAAYEKAIAINANYADAHINLGEALSVLKRHDEAIEAFDKALRIRPDDPDGLTHRAGVLAALRRHGDTIKGYERALAVDPDRSTAYNGLLNSAGFACDWARTGQLSQQARQKVIEGASVSPFIFLAHCSDPALQLECARAYIQKRTPRPIPRLWNGGIWHNKKIKIAYLSCGFHQHPTAYLTAELIEIHDRSRFEILGLSVGPDDQSSIRARLTKAFDQFHDFRSATDGEVAAWIHDLRIDILVDRSGYTMNARPEVFAHRPSPIQVSYIGFPGTLGADFYDYILADRIVLPLDQQPFYMEKIVHLPDSYLVTDSTMEIASQAPPREKVGLPVDGFVFCCFNNNYKINAPIFDIWMRLLRKVDGSVLWLLRDNPDAESNLRREAVARGVDPARLVFAGRLRLEEHLARHRQADLFLDTLPYNAHTTASDALWTGLPVVTCRGEAFAGRVAASLLHAVGMPELVTHTLDDYEVLALRLATEPALLASFRDKLRRNRTTHPLFDTRRYRQHIEAAYTQMWEIWQKGEAPRSFAVDPIPG